MAFRKFRIQPLEDSKVKVAGTNESYSFPICPPLTRAKWNAYVILQPWPRIDTESCYGHVPTKAYLRVGR